MKFSELLLEDETLNEMATSYSDSNTSIRVNPASSGYLDYFKYCNTCNYTSNTAVARISLLGSDYIYNHNDGHPVLLLTSKAKKALNEKLSSNSEKYAGYTVFQAIIIDFNIEKFGVYFTKTIQIKTYTYGKPLPINLPQPDYTKLPSIDEAKKKINKEVVTM